MGSRNSWAKELADRCEAVGWEVTFGPGGHRRIKTHEGKVFSLASSTSDRHGQKNAERACVRHGLEVLEQKLALQREKERLERLEEDRARGVDWEAEERKIEEMKKSEPIHGYVNGVAVLERVPARAAHPRSPGKVVDIKHGMELGLEDGTVIFECVAPVMVNHTYQDCGRQFDAANSLRSHIAWHNRESVQVDEIVKNNIERKMEAVTEPKTTTEELAELGQKIGFFSNVEPVEVKTIPVAQPGIISRLTELAREIDELVDDAAELTEAIRVKRDEYKRLIAELPAHLADNETRAKARKYDAMMQAASE